MEERLVTRREAIRNAALAGMLLPLARRASAAEPALSRGQTPLELGLAGYTLRKFTLDRSIELMQALGVRYVAGFRDHLPIQKGTPEECRAAAARFQEAGLTLTGTSVVQLSGDEEAMGRAFGNAQAVGLKLMTVSYAQAPDVPTLKLTERFVKETGIRLAIHNHGPEDKVFPSPAEAWDLVQPYDERIGLCIDVGHALRAGADPVESIHRTRSRLYDIHIKDTASPTGAKDIPVGLGFGRVDVKGILAALIAIGFQGQVGLEDEVEAPDPVPGIAQSYGYMRGVAAALS